MEPARIQTMELSRFHLGRQMPKPSLADWSHHAFQVRRLLVRLRTESGEEPMAWLKSSKVALLYNFSKPTHCLIGSMFAGSTDSLSMSRMVSFGEALLLPRAHSQAHSPSSRAAAK